MLDSLLQRFRSHDRVALARLVSLVARGEQVEEILAGAHSTNKMGPSQVAAITGSGGVGKSTLVGKLIEQARQQGHTVGVLACDPQSPLSGGALLGDRFRMPSHPEDDGIFIRSLAAAGGHGALAQHLEALVSLLEAYGFDLILIETVGAGQGDTVVRDLVDVLVLLLQPETGDDLQWEKAGLLEVADVIAVNKADLPGADRVEAQVLATLSLGSAPAATVLRVSSRTGQGLPELLRAILKCPRRRKSRTNGHELLMLAQESLANRYASAASSPEMRDLLDRWRRGEMETSAAVARLLRVLGAEVFSAPAQ